MNLTPKQVSIALSAFVLLNSASQVMAQPPQGRGGGPPGGPPPQQGGSADREIVEQFDADANGVLDRVERDAAREFLSENPAGQRRGPRGGRGGGPRPGANEPTPGITISPDEVEHFGDHALYDDSVLRTFFFEFEHDDWEAELEAFFHTDVYVPATMTVDGIAYENVGVKFRGNSSFFTVASGAKRSFNLAMDLVDEDQDLDGYRVTNLLNAHTDPSFMRTVLYNKIARQYIPAPKANHARVVINGENWGVYINAQQLNRDFFGEWFGADDGVRWKVPAGREGRSLNDNGPDRTNYAAYELKSNESEQVWEDLIEVCRHLNSIPIDQLDTELNRHLNVDRALWFLALDNTLIDTDGYYARGSDYYIYQDSDFNRFHLLPYDSNETFRMTGGRRGGPAFGGADPDAEPEPESFRLDPFKGADNESLPLLNRLLANSRLRARYVAHVRTIAEQNLRWETIGPVIDEYRSLIVDDIEIDTKRHSTFETFVEGVAEAPGGGRVPPGLKTFFEQRYEYLMSLPELAAAPPSILGIRHSFPGENHRDLSGPRASDDVIVLADLGSDVDVSSVVLHYSTSRNAPFQSLPMSPVDRIGGVGSSANTTYMAHIPSQQAGTKVSYFVEAIAADEFETTAFSPPRGEFAANSYVVSASPSQAPLIVLNEVMAANTITIQDAEGGFDDWIEIHNMTDRDVSLAGMSLTDDPDDLTKWRFPDQATVPARGFLLVWCDNEAGEGLHTNFKLSKGGEVVLLVDSDERSHQILDSIRWDAMQTDVSYGRQGDGKERLGPLSPTPRRSNGHSTSNGSRR